MWRETKRNNIPCPTHHRWSCGGVKVGTIRKMLKHFKDRHGVINWKQAAIISNGLYGISKDRRLNPEEKMIFYRSIGKTAIQAMVEEGVVDSVVATPSFVNDSIIGFKKHGQLEVFLFKNGRIDRTVALNELPQPVIEIPIQLFKTTLLKFKSNAFSIYLKKALKKIGVIEDPRGGAKHQLDHGFLKAMVEACADFLYTHNDLPTAAQLGAQLPLKYEDIDVSTINKHLPDAALCAIVGILKACRKKKTPK